MYVTGKSYHNFLHTFFELLEDAFTTKLPFMADIYVFCLICNPTKNGDGLTTKHMGKVLCLHTRLKLLIN